MQQSVVRQSTTQIEENKMTIVSLPFTGFYHGYFDNHFQSYAEGMELTDDDIDSIDFNLLRFNYALTYVREVSRHLGVELKFDSLYSPKEYNFRSDEIYVKVPDSLIAEALKTPSLAKFAADWFTSRDGFISFYSPDLDEWDFSNLEEPQMSCAFAAYLEDCGLDLQDIELYMDYYFNI